MSILDQATLTKLDRFRTDVAALPNESAKTHRFMALVTELFPGSNIASKLSGGIEKVVRIDAGTRRIDSYFGNALIEFEKSLDVSLKTAVSQLREQAAGLWNGEDDPARSLLCIASDGIRWETFHAELEAPVTGSVGPADVHLEPLQSLRVTRENLGTFWLWLTGLLFRDAQILPTADRFRLDFGSFSPAYLDGIRRLRQAWEVVGHEGEARVAFEAWRRYLTVTYGNLADSDQEAASPETVELFLKHTFLALVARLLVWAALSKGRAERGLDHAIDGALSGAYFQQRKIENLVESDFFHWALEPRAAAIILPAWEGALSVILTYDLARLSQDVLKGVYQELVDPKDRHDLGEYYTPEWLCTRLVQEMMPESGLVSVLDPTCGSGSFLRAAITHMVERNPAMDKGELLARILDSVVGIDIHPLAVIIARATYVLALRDLISEARRSVQIPVYLADSLFLPNEVSHSLINGAEIEIRFGLAKDRTFYVPSVLLEEPGQFDAAIALAARVAADHARNENQTPEGLSRFLERSLPIPMKKHEAKELAGSLWDFVDSLANLIRERKNSIWAFIIRNGYRPALLKRRFDLIVGNPPWLSFRYISDPDYQSEVKRLAVDQYAIAPREQKLLTQMELASIFLIHTLSTFGKEDARLGFVMPRSVMSADQHGPLRLRSYTANVALTAFWDLFDVRPLFNVPSCVLFAKGIKPSASKSPTKPLPALVWSGSLPHRDVDWALASDRLRSQKRTGRVVWLGDRSAISTTPLGIERALPSGYLKRFHQGATIVPRNFYFVSLDEPATEIEPNSIFWAKTDVEQAKEAKAPYKELFIEGNIEGQFLFRTAIAKNVLPFVVMEPAFVVLPVVIKENRAEVCNSQQLKDDGLRDCGDWMERAEAFWNKHRQRKADRQSVYERLDYQRGLTSQKLELPFLVLYNAAGTNVSAAVFTRKEYEQTFFVDAKLYYYATPRRSEADYLAAILNSGIANELIKPFQSVGLQGERDIHKKVLELPIPLFDSKIPEHVALAGLGAEARREGKRVVDLAESEGWPASLARRRAIVRTQLEDVLNRIDEAVKLLFGLAA